MKADPDKPLYQWKGWPPPGNCWIGGRCYVVEIPQTDADADRALRAREMQRGADLVFYGILVALACAVIHGCSTIKQLKQFSEWGIVGGLLAIVAGMIYKNVTRNEHWIGFVLVVVVGVTLLYLGRNWSISRLLPGKRANDRRK